MYIQNLCFEQKYENYQTFSDKFFVSFYFLQLKKNLACFRNVTVARII